MRKKVYKWDVRRGAALALTAVMLLSSTACSGTQAAASGNGMQAMASGNGTQAMASGNRGDHLRTLRTSAGRDMQADHSDVPYTQRPYEHYDTAPLEQIMADFEKACAVEGQEEEVLRLYGQIIDEYDRLATLAYMAQVAYDRDVSNEEAAAEQAYTTDLYSEMGDRIIVCLAAGMQSSYRQQLADIIGREYAPYIQYYQEKPLEVTDLNKREQELLREYDLLAAGEITVELEDGQWTYSRLEKEKDLSTDRYLQIEDALVREKNRVLGSKYMELAQVRREIAEYRGYDNYVQYSYEAVYGRDYSLQDADRLCSSVKEQIVPLNEDIWRKEVSQESYDYLEGLEESSVEDILEAVGPAMESLNPELGEIFRYMRRNGLYDIQSGENGESRTDSSYTVGLPSYRDGFIFINRSHTFLDYQSLIHEFGHFSTYYYSTEPELFQGFSVDVSEVQSQGLELLANRYAADMFGQGAEAYEYESITDMLYVTIIACMLQEFEEAVYTDPDMSLEDMNRKFKEIQDSYGGRWYYDVYDDGMCYDWVDISHLFYNPLYYMGYGTSALSSLDLWVMSRKDWDGAVDTYMGLLREGTDAAYCDTMYRCGLRDIFDSGELASLAGDVRRLQGLDGDETGGEDSPGSEDVYGPESGYGPGEADLYGDKASGRQNTVGFLTLAGIGTIIVLQVMILCTGFVILWLLVKQRRKD